MARVMLPIARWTVLVLWGVLALLAAACARKAPDRGATEPASDLVSPAYTQEACKQLTGANSENLKPPVEDVATQPQSHRALRVWREFHRYSWDDLRDRGAFLGVLFRTDQQADADYNIAAGTGFTCAWVRHHDGGYGTAGNEDVVLVDANNRIAYRRLFLAMVKKQGAEADGHFDQDEHHLPGLLGFVSDPIRDSQGETITRQSWVALGKAARDAAVLAWLDQGMSDLRAAGPWFPCSQFGCCKVQGS